MIIDDNNEHRGVQGGSIRISVTNVSTWQVPEEG